MPTLPDLCDQASTEGAAFVNRMEELLSCLEGLEASNGAVFDAKSLEQGGQPFGRLREAQAKGREAVEMLAKGVSVLRESTSFRDCFCDHKTE